MPDLVIQCGNDLILPLQEVRPRQVLTGYGVMRDEGAVAGQVFHGLCRVLLHFIFFHFKTPIARTPPP